MILRFLSAAVLATSLAAAAAEREAGLDARRDRLKQKWEAQFRSADTDADRLLTREEIRAAQLPESLLTRFEDIDTDDDARLSPDELWAVHEKRLEAQRRPSGPPR